MKRMAAIGAIGAAAAMVASVLGGTGHAQAPHERTIILFENEKTTKLSVVDEPPLSTSHLSVGDEFNFYTPLFNKAKQRVGTGYGKATVVLAPKNPDKARFLNDIVISLHDGTLSAHGLFVGGKLNSYAITGGTGTYAGAHGSFAETRTGDIITLLP